MIICFRGFTWQDPCQVAPPHHQHSLCPTLPHFQYTVGAHLPPSQPPIAKLVCSTQLRKCGQPGKSLCTYTIQQKDTKRGGGNLSTAVNWHVQQWAVMVWKTESFNVIISLSLTSTFSSVQSLAGKYTTSWTSSQGLSEFLPKIMRCPSVEGGRATNVSQENGCISIKHCWKTGQALCSNLLARCYSVRLCPQI